MASGSAVSVSPDKREIILQELERILESRFFRNTARSKQFLRYVVERSLDHCEPLKERTIGVELFERPANYATGDDPVVRVQAGEVRRRLDQYYRSAATTPAIRIQIPVGSYSPLFYEEQTAPVPSSLAVETTVGEVSAVATHPNVGLRRWRVALACLAILAVAAILFWAEGSRFTRSKTAIDEFWQPVFATPQPVLVCLSMPVVYRPTQALFDRYAAKHPGSFQTNVERLGALPFAPDEKIAWGELMRTPDYGVARGDTYAAVTLSALLGKIGKTAQVRIGEDYSFGDLKNSPAVVVGAFNNRWTLQMTSNLHFGFVAEEDKNRIVEHVANGRTWLRHYDKDRRPVDDFAIVARLLDSNTGQFTIIVAGIGTEGTQAASELITRPELLEAAARSFSPGWEKKNLEIVLQTDVTDFVPGPPHVAAMYAW